MKNEGEYLKSHYRHVSRLEHVARFTFGAVISTAMGIAATGIMLYKTGILNERKR